MSANFGAGSIVTASVGGFRAKVPQMIESASDRRVQEVEEDSRHLSDLGNHVIKGSL